MIDGLSPHAADECDVIRDRTKVRQDVGEFGAAYRPSDAPPLWPVMRDDWHQSMRGSTATINLFWLEQTVGQEAPGSRHMDVADAAEPVVTLCTGLSLGVTLSVLWEDAAGGRFQIGRAHV